MTQLTETQKLQAKEIATRLLPTYRMEIFSGWTTKYAVINQIAKNGKLIASDPSPEKQVFAQALRLVYKRLVKDFNL